jgi:diguanylate cyclase (GGDEF)-like protein
MIIASADGVMAATLAERVREVVESLEVELPTHSMLRLTASIGFATIAPDDSPETLFARADAALYEAKRLGRNRVAEVVANSHETWFRVTPRDSFTAERPAAGATPSR